MLNIEFVISRSFTNRTRLVRHYMPNVQTFSLLRFTRRNGTQNDPERHQQRTLCFIALQKQKPSLQTSCHLPPRSSPRYNLQLALGTKRLTLFTALQVHRPPKSCRNDPKYAQNVFQIAQQKSSMTLFICPVSSRNVSMTLYRHGYNSKFFYSKKAAQE